MSMLHRLVDGEDEVALETRPHAAALSPALGRAAGIVGLCAAGVLGLAFLNAGPWRLAAAIFAGIAAAAVARAARAVWRWDHTLLAITEREVIVLTQSARLQAVRVPLSGIDRLTVRQTVPGRVLGFGTVELVDGRARRGLAYVPDPGGVSDLILRLRDGRAAESAPVPHEA